MKTLFVSNLTPDTDDGQIEQLFGEFGTVRGVKIAMDVFSGQCRGHATVDMEGHEARAAMSGLNGRDFKGNALRVSEERKRVKGKTRGRR
ncbi:RNA recognition motif domain-containing protein [Thiohalophilus thiocyanatoxydans]|uniref:RNA recognition motif-containing protein n=1 Tax=Thiohalophilus thiocyanatoxydans TaxID=381308 RepID=A0A4R8ITD9_9GAMM|nr:RNA-binding protein [Thiohalophilus thiocyanatoxydans]TDY00513.1 RNA recognition motif-containing protein [Thiohalophilus thiocyanatoxydans]